MNIKTSNIALISSDNMFGRVLFRDKNGNDVTAGDSVEFYIDGEIFPHYGSVDDLYGLNVACFNQLTNKWNYYPVDINKEKP